MTKIDISIDRGIFDDSTSKSEAPAAPGRRLSYAQRIIETPALYDHTHNAGAANRNPDGIAFWKLIAEDYRTQEAGLFSQGFWALFWHRFGNWRMSVQAKPLRAPLSFVYKFGAKLTQWFAGVDLPYTVNVGRRVRIEHFGGMILIARAIGDDVTIRQNTTFGLARTERLKEWPVIGDGADIGAGAAILGKIDIGRGVRVGANAVVLRNIPAGAVAVGVPARVVPARVVKET